MSSRNLILTVRPAIGGLDLTSDPTILDPNYLVTADNINYLEGGQRKRRMGTLQYSTSTGLAGTSSATNLMVTSSAPVRALLDTWDYSSGGLTPVQRLVAVTSRSLFRSTMDGKWTMVSATSSFNGGRETPFSAIRAQDHVVLSNGIMQPVAYQLATTTLVSPTTGANWPIFESARYHQNRLVMLGLSTAASNVLVTAANNIFDSTGVDSVQLPIDPGDGDRVMGASETFFGNLYIFKGPQFGSVHQISGNTSTDYVKAKITSGAACVSNKSIITTPTDIYWMSHHGIHSLQTTLKFGDVEQGFLSLPIQNLWRKGILENSFFDNTTGFWDPLRNVVGWTVGPEGGDLTTGGMFWCIVYNYALSDPTPGGKKFWSLWKISREPGAKYGIRSAARVILPTVGFQSTRSKNQSLFFGGDNGLAYDASYPYFEDDGQAFPSQITTPFITRFRTDQGAIPETQEKQFTGFVTYFTNDDSGTPSAMNYSASVDAANAGTGTLQSITNGGILGQFILGQDILGGLSFIFAETIIEGRGRSLQLTWTQPGLKQDFEHLGYSVRFAAAEPEAKEAL